VTENVLCSENSPLDSAADVVRALDMRESRRFSWGGVGETPMLVVAGDLLPANGNNP
jgi:hypothetical protein